MYSKKVEENQNKADACFWKKQFERWNSLTRQDILEGSYIIGLISQRQLAKDMLSWEIHEEKASEEQNVNLFTMIARIDRDHLCIILENSYVQSAREQLEFEKFGQKL